jgi:hypothetical protein
MDLRMDHNDALNYFERIELQDPADIAVQQLKGLIRSKKLTPGEKLPSEQKLEERMGISRSAIRRALKILNAYGFVKTIPQSGTYVADLGVNGLGGMLSAGVFLNKFIPSGQAWVHLDIAGPAFNESKAHDYTPVGGTGVAVRTLVQLVSDRLVGLGLVVFRQPFRPDVSTSKKALQGNWVQVVWNFDAE